MVAAKFSRRGVGRRGEEANARRWKKAADGMADTYVYIWTSRAASRRTRTEAMSKNTMAMLGVVYIMWRILLRIRIGRFYLCVVLRRALREICIGWNEVLPESSLDDHL
ncbi:hypothetical protein U1Q18_046584 [Sarracenia purpurea var. burkii]